MKVDFYRHDLLPSDARGAEVVCGAVGHGCCGECLFVRADDGLLLVGAFGGEVARVMYADCVNIYAIRV